MRKASFFLASTASPYTLSFHEKLLLEAFRTLDKQSADASLRMLCNLAEAQEARKELEQANSADPQTRTRRGK